MARIEGLKVNSRAIEEGEWHSPGEDYDDMLLRVRGLTDQYFDAQSTRMRKAAIPYGGDMAKIPSAKQREIRIECLIDHVFIDVKNLTMGSVAVTADRFRDLMRDPDYGALVTAVYQASAMVGRVEAVAAEEAAGN